jgi:hypothetical protein
MTRAEWISFSILAGYCVGVLTWYGVTKWRRMKK